MKRQEQRQEQYKWSIDRQGSIDEEIHQQDMEEARYTVWRSDNQPQGRT